MDRRLIMGACWNGIGQDSQRSHHGMTVPIAQPHQAGQAQWVLVTRARAVELAVVVLDFIQHQMDEPFLFGIQFFHHARFNPDASFQTGHLPGSCRRC